MGSVDAGRLWASLLTGAPGFMWAVDKRTVRIDASHRGGNPGFVRVLGSGRIAFPDYAGNSVFNTLGNIAATGRAGLLFLDVARGHTLQLTGHARVDWEPARAAQFAGAERVVEVDGAETIERTGGDLPR